ncbi:hypothetical protein J2P12_07890 [Candidatus Bathyarchaeota archaeon]|nr:hypothetical protein [Candidatus Bathyarchaeota archaeon]
MRSVVFAAFLLVLIPVWIVPANQTTGAISNSQSLSSPAGGTAIVAVPPTGTHIIIKSVYGAAYLNNSGNIVVFPATLFLNMTDQSSNSTGIIFSVDSGNVTEGIPGLACPSTLCDYRVWKVFSGTAFLSYAGRLTINAATIETSPPTSDNKWQLSLTGPSRLTQAAASSQAYSLFTLLYGHISNSTDSIGLIFLAGIGVKKGDVDMDGTVDIVDLATVARSFGTSYGQANYNPYADVTMHGAVNIQDLAAVAYDYGQTY